jgi:hypothetical protein
MLITFPKLFNYHASQSMKLLFLWWPLLLTLEIRVSGTICYWMDYWV